jgi:tRNA-2-methylthio-N6-dimethylallyladenosine synthase
VYVLRGPFTRGRERSREPQSIMKEIQDYGKVLKKLRFGQNVDSLWYGGGLKKDLKCYRNAKATAVDFDQLLEMVAG